MLNADGYRQTFITTEMNKGIADDGSEYVFEYQSSANQIIDCTTNFNLYDNSVVYVTSKDNVRYEFRTFTGNGSYKLVRIFNVDNFGNQSVDTESINIFYTQISSNIFLITSINKISQNEVTKASITFYYDSGSEISQSSLSKINELGILVTYSKVMYYYNNTGRIDHTIPLYDYNNDGLFTTGKTTYFSYDMNNNLISAYKSISTNINDGLYILNNNSGKVNSVESKYNSVVMDKTSFIYNGDFTIITDKDNNSVDLYFDQYGRYIGSKNRIGIISSIDYYENGTGNVNYHMKNKIINKSSFTEFTANLLKNGDFENSYTSWSVANTSYGTRSLYTCTSRDSICSSRVSSGKKSMFIKQYSGSLLYSMRQNSIIIDEGYYYLSAYINNIYDTNILKLSVEGTNISESISFGKTQDNNGLDLYRLMFKSAMFQVVNVKIEFSSYPVKITHLPISSST
jgi:hypothetical protein